MPKVDQEAVERLREWIKPGDILYTSLKHVSRSGMMRWIGIYRMQDNQPIGITGLVALATGDSYDERREAVKIGGVGMDMGFALVYELSHILFPDGFDCIGDKCPSNDHFNGDRDYTSHHHGSGGYALKQRWL